MGKAEGYREFLRKPATGNHFVQVYQDDGLLVDAICYFISDELKPAEGVVIIATPEHREAVIAQLSAQSEALQKALQSDQFVFYDAGMLLSSFMVDGMPDKEKCFSVIIPILEQAARKYKSVRAYGEMVDILWQAGNKIAASTLEKFWNELIQRHAFSLLCAYRVDNLDPAAYHGDIECLCSTHTHFIPAQDFDLLEKAVSKASENVMGVSLSGMMGSIAKFPHPTTIMPAAQASLLYISKTMPVTTDYILTQVRSHLSKAAKPAREKQAYQTNSLAPD